MKVRPLSEFVEDLKINHKQLLNMDLPKPFIEELSAALPESKAAEIISTIGGIPSVAVRLNPLKLQDVLLTGLPLADGDAVRTYSRYGYFLSARPEFAAEPLFHAGAYYVQEASSMYLEQALSGYLTQMSEAGAGLAVLDLCASPGGKSTHLLSMLDDCPGSFLVSNEVIRSRVGSLCENVSKWGRANSVVTSEDPAVFGGLESFFDVIVADAPCSGEGMFRKNPESVVQWSSENVQICAARQKRILTDVMPALKPGGLLVYSTCTYNHFEDEDNVAFLQEKYGMEVLDVRHFYPGEPMAGEGFFLALLRNAGEWHPYRQCGASRGAMRKKSAGQQPVPPVPFVKDGFRTVLRGSKIWALPVPVADRMEEFGWKMRVLQSGNMVASLVSGSGGEKQLVLPEHGVVQSETLCRGYFQEAELPLEQALAYISRGQLVLVDSPKGYVLLTYKGVPLGLVKNLGNRCNNLWPESLRLRSSQYSR